MDTLLIRSARAWSIGCISAVALSWTTAASAVDLDLMMSNVGAKTTILADFAER